MADDESSDYWLGRLLLVSVIVHSAAVIVLDALLVARLNWAFIGWLAVDAVLGACTPLATFLYFFVDVAWRPQRRARHYANLEAGGDAGELAETRSCFLEPFFWILFVVYCIWHVLGNVITPTLPYNALGLWIARICVGFGFAGFWVGLGVLLGVGAFLAVVFQGCASVCMCGLLRDACVRACCPCVPVAAAVEPDTHTPGRDSEDSADEL